MSRNWAIRLLFIALMLCLALPALAEDNVHVLDCTADLTAMAQGEKADGDTTLVKDFFTVIYSAKTKIDGNKSYVYITDQHVQFSNYTHPDGGDQCLASNYINRKFTFQQLLSSSYLPFTFPEWTGDDKIEQTECGMNVGSTVYAKGVVEEDENRTFKNTAENVPATITASQLFKAKITSNYYIMDLYFQVYNADGVEVYKLASRPIKDAGVKEFQFFKAGDSKEEWGSLDVLDPTKEYTVKISAQLGTGERPVVWEGKLAWDK